jgi:hypothetical protein
VSASLTQPSRGLLPSVLATLGMTGTVGGALAFEHIGGYIPCALCLMQRTPVLLGHSDRRRRDRRFGIEASRLDDARTACRHRYPDAGRRWYRRLSRRRRMAFLGRSSDLCHIGRRCFRQCRRPARRSRQQAWSILRGCSSAGARTFLCRMEHHRQPDPGRHRAARRCEGVAWHATGSFGIAPVRPSIPNHAAQASRSSCKRTRSPKKHKTAGLLSVSSNQNTSSPCGSPSPVVIPDSRTT